MSAVAWTVSRDSEVHRCMQLHGPYKFNVLVLSTMVQAIKFLVCYEVLTLYPQVCKCCISHMIILSML